MVCHQESRRRAHPRAGGDGRPSCRASLRRAGSPPRRRGRHTSITVRTSAHGLTPAQAGTARSRSACVWAFRAHPRAGGDGLVPASDPVRPAGSPPRRRGRPSAGMRQPKVVGLTPAQAGTAPKLSRVGTLGRAHPRAGGDGKSVPPRHRAPSGSPPRRRGRPGSVNRHVGDAGLTPAQAGTAVNAVTHFAYPRAHPRAGGDGSGGQYSYSYADGSPPRRRGRP